MMQPAPEAETGAAPRGRERRMMREYDRESTCRSREVLFEPGCLARANPGRVEHDKVNVAELERVAWRLVWRLEG